MARLRSARLTDDTLVSDIPLYLGELEQDIAAIFGFTVDSDITASAFSCDNSGRLTKSLLRFKARGNIHEDEGVSVVGLSITNTTNSVAIIAGTTGLEATQDGSDPATVPVLGFGNFTLAGNGTVYDRDESLPGFALLLETAADLQPYYHLWGALFSTGQMGLLPRASGLASEYLCSDGTFKSPGLQKETVLLGTPIDASYGTNTNFTVDDQEDLFWTTEDFDASGLHATNDDEVIIVNAGKYHVLAQVRITPDSLDAGYVTVKLYRDRSATDTLWAERSFTYNTDANDPNVCQVETIIDCEAGDKLYVQVAYITGIGGFYTINAGSASSNFSVARIT